MKILDRKHAINRRLYEGLIIVETAIYRVYCLNRTVPVTQVPYCFCQGCREIVIVEILAK